MAYKNTYLRCIEKCKYMLLHYVVLSDSDLSASQVWVHYTYTDKDTHSPSARERIEVSETKATFRPSASCVWRFPNKWLSSCKPADKANKGREHLSWVWDERGKEKENEWERQNYGVFSCLSPLWCPQWKWHLLHSPFHHLCGAHHSGSAEVKMEKRTLSKGLGAIKRAGVTTTCRTGAAPWCSSALMREDDE